MCFSRFNIIHCELQPLSRVQETGIIGRNSSHPVPHFTIFEPTYFLHMCLKFQRNLIKIMAIIAYIKNRIKDTKSAISPKVLNLNWTDNFWRVKDLCWAGYIFKVKISVSRKMSAQVRKRNLYTSLTSIKTTSISSNRVLLVQWYTYQWHSLALYKGLGK